VTKLSFYINAKFHILWRVIGIMSNVGENRSRGNVEISSVIPSLYQSIFLEN